jgi:hypothetical protein
VLLRGKILYRSHSIACHALRNDNAMLSIEKSSIHDVFVRLNRNDPVAVDICGSSLRKHGQTVLDVTFIDLGWRRPAKSGL